MTEMRSGKVGISRILASGMKPISDKYVFRGIMMAAVNACEDIPFDEIQQELSLMYNIMIEAQMEARDDD